MAALKNVAFMGASTAVRLVFGLLTFALLARLLGPSAFGALMLWLSIATLVAMLANYGFTPYLLREIGANPASAIQIMNEVFGSKVLVSGVLILLAVCAVPLLAPQARWIFVLLLLAMLADSMTDFLNVGYRVTNRFSSETRIVTIGAISQFVIVAGTVWYARDAFAAAAAFLMSRVVVLFMTWLNQRQYFSKLQPASFSRATARLRDGASYALDFGLQSLIGQIDSVILNYFLGPTAVGLHQAGMRLFLGGTQIANVLGNVFIPRLSGMVEQTAKLQKEAHHLQAVFIGVGAFLGLTLAIAATPIVHLLFGPKFSALVSLLPWFGLLFFVRFVAAAHGILLTAAGKQLFRTKANLLHWVMILAAAWALVPNLGNLGWLLALTAGNLLLGTLYFAATRNLFGVSRLNASLVVISFAGFVPFLSSN